MVIFAQPVGDRSSPQEVTGSQLPGKVNAPVVADITEKTQNLLHIIKACLGNVIQTIFYCLQADVAKNDKGVIK